MVQEITTTSWGKRIINACWGVLIGLTLIIGAFFLIFWNEGNSLHTAQALEQIQKIITSVPNKPIDEKNNGKVIYITGLATTENILSDKLLKLSENVIQLNRKVEMYQWKEDVETKTEKNMGGSEQDVKTYQYNKQWSSDLIKSSDFKEQNGHENPSSMSIKSEIQYAKKVTLGDFKLPTELIKQISGDKIVELDKVNTDELKNHVNKPIHVQTDQIYIGEDEQAPKIGDIRISVTAVYPQDVSIVAQQSVNTLQAYVPPAGHPVMLLEMGQHSSEELIHNAAVENRIMMWTLRIASLAMLIIGFALIMSPIAVLADFIPFLGSLVGFGTGFIAFTLGFCLWFIAMAIAWFAVRPMMSASLIVAAIICGCLFFVYKRGRI